MSTPTTTYTTADLPPGAAALAVTTPDGQITVLRRDAGALELAAGLQLLADADRGA